jgi:hypothetical protein
MRVMSCRGIDWGRAARLLAEGAGLARVAEIAGGTPLQIGRRWRHDPRFRRWIEEARGDPPAPDPEARLARWLLIEAHRGNPRALLHLARAPKRARPDDDHPTLEEVLAGLDPQQLEAFQRMTHDWPGGFPEEGIVGDGKAGGTRSGAADTAAAGEVGAGEGRADRLPGWSRRPGSSR